MYSAVYNHSTWKLNWRPINILGDTVFYLRLTWFYSPYELTSGGWNSASVPPSFLGGVLCFTVRTGTKTSVRLAEGSFDFNSAEFTSFGLGSASSLKWVLLSSLCFVFYPALCCPPGGAFLHQPFIRSLWFRPLLQHAPFLLSRSTIRHLCGAHDTENKIPMTDTFMWFGEKQLIPACSFSTPGRTLMMP